MYARFRIHPSEGIDSDEYAVNQYCCIRIVEVLLIAISDRFISRRRVITFQLWFRPNYNPCPIISPLPNRPRPPPPFHQPETDIFIQEFCPVIPINPLARVRIWKWLMTPLWYSGGRQALLVWDYGENLTNKTPSHFTNSPDCKLNRGEVSLSLFDVHARRKNCDKLYFWP